MHTTLFTYIFLYIWTYVFVCQKIYRKYSFWAITYFIETPNVCNKTFKFLYLLQSIGLNFIPIHWYKNNNVCIIIPLTHKLVHTNYLHHFFTTAIKSYKLQDCIKIFAHSHVQTVMYLIHVYAQFASECCKQMLHHVRNFRLVNFVVFVVDRYCFI